MLAAHTVVVNTFYIRLVLNQLLVGIPSQLPEGLAFMLQQLPVHIAWCMKVVMTIMS